MNLYANAKLSPQEIRCCDLLLKGMNPQEVADIMFVDRKTTYTHRARAFEKLNVRNSVELSRLRVQAMLSATPMTIFNQPWRAGYRTALHDVLQP